MSDLRKPLRVSGQGSGQAAGSSLSSLVYVGTYTQSLSPAGEGSEGIYNDSLVLYSVDEDSGRLTCTGHEPTGGNYPRNFSIDPTGNFHLVANQNSGTIRAFWIDAQTGKLSFSGQVTQVPAPVCIKFF